MHGVFQTIFQRGISAGLYFPLEEIFTSYLRKSFKDSKKNSLDETRILLCAGLLAGAGNGMIMNPMSSIKYHYWGASGGSVDFSGSGPTGVKNTFISVAMNMLQRGGLRPFFVGANATISRDVIFGGLFAYLRHELPRLPLFSSYCSCECNPDSDTNSPASSSQRMPLKSAAISSNRPTSIYTTSTSSNEKRTATEINCDTVPKKFEIRHTFLTDLIAGLVATTVSSPMNYVRNIHYSLPPDIIPSSAATVLRDLWHKALEEETLLGKLSHLQSRLRLGWGTARVGCGMAVASQCYSLIKTLI